MTLADGASINLAEVGQLVAQLGVTGILAVGVYVLDRRHQAVVAARFADQRVAMRHLRSIVSALGGAHPVRESEDDEAADEGSGDT